MTASPPFGAASLLFFSYHFAMFKQFFNCFAGKRPLYGRVVIGIRTLFGSSYPLSDPVFPAPGYIFVLLQF